MISTQVSGCPSYRRIGALTEHPTETEQDKTWTRLFGEDVRKLATEVLLHICGESCWKHSGGKAVQMCRHGFYYIVQLEDWRRRRRGKALRNSLFVIKQTDYGMQGRVMQFQEHPFECTKSASYYLSLGYSSFLVPLPPSFLHVPHPSFLYIVI